MRADRRWRGGRAVPEDLKDLHGVGANIADPGQHLLAKFDKVGLALLFP
jgi:hypothetical protein